MLATSSGAIETGSGGTTAQGDAPHGASQVWLIPAQWSEAIATGGATTNAVSSKTTSTRPSVMVEITTIDAQARQGVEVL